MQHPLVAPVLYPGLRHTLAPEPERLHPRSNSSWLTSAGLSSCPLSRECAAAASSLPAYPFRIYHHHNMSEGNVKPVVHEAHDVDTFHVPKAFFE